MLSSITLASLFVEIFASGILLAGAIALLSSWSDEKGPKDLWLSLTFMVFFTFTIVGVVATLANNFGTPVSWLIFLQRTIYFLRAVMLIPLWFFIRARFNIPTSGAIKAVSVIGGLFLAYFAFLVLWGPLSLIYRADVVEPLVILNSNWGPLAFWAIWVALWGYLAFRYFRGALTDINKKQFLTLTGAISCFFILSALASTWFYLRNAESNFLLVSWGFNLFGIIGLTLSEVISPRDAAASNPIVFFQSRLIFKMILVMVLLIIVVFETTALVSITFTKRALAASVSDVHWAMAREMERAFYQASISPSKLNDESIQTLVENISSRGKGIVYVVDHEGKVLFHPDQVLSKTHADQSKLIPVAAVMKGKTGEGEYDLGQEERSRAVFLPLSSPIAAGIIVQQPLPEAYAQIRQVETIFLIFVILGMTVTVVVGIFFMQGIEHPIKQLITGVEAIREGDLSYKIKVDSKDEIGELAKEFNHMTLELKDSQERLILSEKMAALGTMSAGMAHEIKNPLVSLRTFTQLLPQKWEDPEFRQKFSSIVPREIERINKIAEGLLRFGKPIKVEFTKTDVNKVLEDAVALMQGEGRQKSIKFFTKYTDLPLITADPSQLSQAFINIILNAIQAVPANGTLTIKTDVGKIVKLGKKGLKSDVKKVGDVREMAWGQSAGEEPAPTAEFIPAIFVEISDSGEGIPEENMRSLFDPFFTTKVSGTGMGLPITLRIIEEHQGMIKVRSQPGKGTTFIITLPQQLASV